MPVEIVRLPAMSESSLQERLAPEGRCFGCGPANPDGLRIRSHDAGDEVVADWHAAPRHEAFSGVVNGGIIGTLLDCHGNWAAIRHLMRTSASDTPPSTVTAEYSIRLVRPTPSDRPIRLRAHVVEAAGRRATVEGSIEADGEVTATSRATYVSVGPDHPAYGRW
jgi:acyl-coenzyme A thioesterase PaaI-like protein